MPLYALILYCCSTMLFAAPLSRCIEGNIKDCVRYTCSLKGQPDCRARCRQLAVDKCKAISHQRQFSRMNNGNETNSRR